MIRAIALALFLTTLLGCGEHQDRSTEHSKPEAPSVTITGANWKDQKDDGTGSLYVQTTDRKEHLVAKDATKHWFSNDRKTLYYSYLISPTGGEGIKRYVLETGVSELIFDYGLEVLSLIEAPAKSGRSAVIVNMIEPEGGTPEVVVADPERGRVHTEKLAQFYALDNGMVVLGIYTPKQLAGSQFGQWPKPDRTGTYDLDDLLDREASRAAPSD